MAKKIFYEAEARDKVLSGAKQLYDAVKVTFGPKGQNVIIEKEYGGPLVWERMTNNRACRIKDEIQCHTFEIDNWTEVFAFMKSAGQRMFDVFHKYISEFSAK